MEEIVADEKFNSATPELFSRFKFLSDREVVRRHSISLIDRSPPRHSLAANILEKTPSLASVKLLWSQIADIKNSLSDFNSCAEDESELESSAESSGESSGDSGNNLKEGSGFKTMNEKKRERKRKRKLAQTPTKEEFLNKKANTQKSPQ